MMKKEEKETKIKRKGERETGKENGRRKKSVNVCRCKDEKNFSFSSPIMNHLDSKFATRPSLKAGLGHTRYIYGHALNPDWRRPLANNQVREKSMKHRPSCRWSVGLIDFHRISIGMRGQDFRIECREPMT